MIAPVVASSDMERVEAPRLRLMLAEARAVFEAGSFIAAYPWLARLEPGDGHSVLVLPGFLAGDGSTLMLRRFLKRLGYDVHGWELGRNLGTHTDLSKGVDTRVSARLDEIAARSGRRVSVVGWSLGGLYARELAWHQPDLVRQVITLGSPFRGNIRANHVYRLFEKVSGLKVSDVSTSLLRELGSTPPVPTTAIFSRSDGIAAWQCCVEVIGSESESIQVRGSHCGLGFNPTVAWAVADRLAQLEGGWSHFRRSGLRKAAFGKLTG